MRGLAGLLLALALASNGTRAAEQTVQRGPVTATVRVTPETVPIGDAVVLELEVRAAPGVEVLMPAFGESLERFEVLDFVPEEQIDATGNQVARQRYRLYASSSGAHRIPPLIVEFVDRRPGERPAPQGEDAYELLTDAVDFTVESVVPGSAGSALKPLPEPLDPIATPASTGWEIAAAGLALLALALPFAWRWWRRANQRARQRSAYDIAQARLEHLRAQPLPSPQAAAEMDAFFVELSAIVRRYLEDRFSLHAPELTTEEFLDVAAASPDLTGEHRRFLQEFLRTADQVKFARQPPQSDYLASVLGAVSTFLEQTRASSAPATDADHARTVPADPDPESKAA